MYTSQKINIHMIGNTSILASPFGPIFLAASSKGLTHCCFQDPWLSSSKQITLPSPAEDCDHHHHHPWKEEGTQQHLVLQLAETQLREYFAGQRQEFNLPLDLSPHGTTDFQLQVWTKLQSIPYGTVPQNHISTLPRPSGTQKL
jgi:methylated-DNA-[protein]-cysteine S-methyltransferase